MYVALISNSGSVRVADVAVSAADAVTSLKVEPGKKISLYILGRRGSSPVGSDEYSSQAFSPACRSEDPKILGS